MPPDELARELRVKRVAREAYEGRLAAMERDGQILTNRKGELCIVAKLDLVVGIVQGHADGFGFLVPFFFVVSGMAFDLDALADPSALAKLAQARKIIDDSTRDIRLEIDGGVKVDNIAEVARAGADTFVAGSAIFGTKDYKATLKAMRDQLATVR